MKCPECGTEAREGTRFCRSCGELLTDDTGPLTNPPLATQPAPALAPAPVFPPAPPPINPVPISPPAPLPGSGTQPFTSGMPPAAVPTGKMAPMAPLAPLPGPPPSSPGEHRTRATSGGGSLAPPPPAPIVRHKTTSKPLVIGAAFAALVLLGIAIGVGYRWGKETADKQVAATQNNWKSTSVPQKERGEMRINKSYLTRVEVSFMDVAPQNDAEIVFVESNKGLQFPSGVKALVLQLQGNPPADTQLSIVWKQGATVIQRTTNRDELNNLGRLPAGANFGIYKTNRAAIDDGEYEVQIEEKGGEIAAYAKFVIGK